MGNFLLTFFKVIFITLNILLILGGIASLAGGIYLAAAPQHYLRLTELGAIGLGQVGLVRTCGYLLIAAGGAAILLAALGLAAAKNENACLYILYATILMIILGVELAALILGILYKEEWIVRLKTQLDSQISTRFDGKLKSADVITAAINSIHQEFDCCGINNASDFDSATKWNRTTATGEEMQIPPSCCYDYQANTTCVIAPTPQNAHISMGCWGSIENLMERYTLIMIIIAAITFCTEVFLIVFSLCLVGKLRSGYSLEKK